MIDTKFDFVLYGGYYDSLRICDWFHRWLSHLEEQERESGVGERKRTGDELKGIVSGKKL